MLCATGTVWSPVLVPPRFAVFGLGSRAYPNFCSFAHTIDNLLLALGAEQVYTCGEGDELCGQEESFHAWLKECYLVSGTVCIHVCVGGEGGREGSQYRTTVPQ